MKTYARASAIGALVVLLASCKGIQPSLSSGSELPSANGGGETLEAAGPYRPAAFFSASGAPSPALALAVSRGAATDLQAPAPLERPPRRTETDVEAAVPQSPPTPAQISEPAADPSDGQVLRVRTTAYCSDEHDHFTFGTMSALGEPLTSSGPVRSAAADWSEFPAGTTFRLVGHPEVFRIDDYGSALVGTRTIDLFFQNPIAMDEWGARKVEIEILKWGSRERSLKILQTRSGHEHIDDMIRGLESNLER